MSIATPTNATLSYAPKTVAATKFRKEPGEIVHHKGNLNLTVGEAGLKNLFTGKYKVTECTAFLTNQRFVATPLRKYFPFGPLIWLIRAFFARKIVFSFPLTELAAIQLNPAAKSQIILQTTTGQEYTLVSVAIFSSIPKWLTALTAAVTQASPNTTCQQSESAITFSRG